MTAGGIDRPLRDIAAAVRDGSLDPARLAAQCLVRARTRAPDGADGNAFTVLADTPVVGTSGPLAGVPYAAKDALETAVLDTCAASPALEGLRIDGDADIIDRLTRAGATLIGKTNMHELSFGVTSNNAAFGPVRNPYDPARSAGGSSGGSAAAVASGAAAFALAADTGGSARIPAALCGLVGFRPTTGRWPDRGLLKVSPTRDAAGAICRSVDDVALLDAIVTGDGAPLSAPPLSSLRLALLTDPYMTDVSPAIRSAVTAGLDRLRAAGAVIEAVSGRDLFELEEACGFAIALFEARGEMHALADRLGLPFAAFVRKVAGPDVRGILESLAEPGDKDAYETALHVTRPKLQQAYADIFAAGFDAVVLPATPVTAPRIGEDEEIDLNGRAVPVFSTLARHTSPASVAGVPSITIPIGCADDGLPVGLLAEAPAGADRRLLAVAEALSGAVLR